MRLIQLALAGLLVLCAPLIAAAEPYVLDKSHAHVTFRVSHLGFSMVLGQFRKFDAKIDFDPGNVEATQVDFTIDAASVDTLWEARDKDVRSPNFLDVANHPFITFVTTSVVPTGTNTADVTGDLMIRGVTLPITLKAVLNRLGPSPFDARRTIAGFTVTGEIDRTAYGITYAAPAIGAIMPIRIDLEIISAK